MWPSARPSATSRQRSTSSYPNATLLTTGTWVAPAIRSPSSPPQTARVARFVSSSLMSSSFCSARQRAAVHGARTSCRPTGHLEGAQIVVDAMDAVDHVSPAGSVQRRQVGLLERGDRGVDLLGYDRDLAAPVESWQRLRPYPRRQVEEPVRQVLQRLVAYRPRDRLVEA